MFKFLKFIILTSIFFSPFALFGQNRSEINILKTKIIESSDTVRVNLLLDLSKLYIHHHKDTAFHYIELALEEAERINSKKSIAKIKDISGYYYFLAERYDDAKKILHEAEAYFDSVDSKAGLISCYDKLALIYLRMHNSTKSFEYYTKELKLAEELGDKRAKANAINNIAIFYYNEKKYDKALEQYEIALEINTEDLNEKGIALALNNIAEIYKLKAYYEKAFEYYFEAKEIMERNEFKHELGYCLGNIGETYIYINDFESALTFTLEAKSIFTQISDTYGLAEIYNNLGEIYDNKQNYSKAVFYYELSLQNARQINSLDHIKDNYLKIAGLYEKINQPAKALASYKKYTEIKDSIQELYNTQTINQLKINYETEKKDKQIQVLSAEAELNKYKNTQKTIIIVVLLLASVALIIILVIVFIQKKEKNEAYNDLVIKNLEIMKSHNELIEAKTKMEALSKEKKEEASDKIIDDKSDKYNKSNLNEQQKQELFDELILLMEEEKHYLNKDLKLSNIAKILETNNLYLSQVINQKSGSNFNNFINKYRINEARKFLSDPNYANFSIEGIASEVGFKSKSTFNIAFKKYTGLTPSFFRKKAQET